MDRYVITALQLHISFGLYLTNIDRHSKHIVQKKQSRRRRNSIELHIRDWNATAVKCTHLSCFFAIGIKDVNIKRKTRQQNFALEIGKHLDGYRFIVIYPISLFLMRTLLHTAYLYNK